jgi:HK97 family phage portal protein
VLQTNGVLTKSPNTRTLWEGQLRDWPASFGTGFVWSSYAALYRSQLWVNTVIDKRGKAAARLPFKVYANDNGSRVNASASPFGRLMAAPSKSMDPFTFWLWTQSTKDIHGESVWLISRDRGDRPIELHPIHPTKLHDEEDQDGKVTWKIRLRSGDIAVERRDLVIHREFNPDTLRRGMSKLEALRSTLENEYGARTANSALWRNGGRPSVALQHPQTLSDGAVARLSAQWAEIHSGVENWAKAAILEEGMTANVLPMNVEELQYIEARKLNREEVCAAYDVPPPVVHILDRATFSNIVEQMRSMYRDTMGPVVNSLESTIEYELRDGSYGSGEPNFPDGIYGEFLLDEVLRGDFEQRAAAYQQSDFLTLAEKREKENLPFIPGTDYIFLNSATLPLGPNGLLVQPAAAPAPVQAVQRPQEPLALTAGTPTPPKAHTPMQPISLRTLMGRLSRAKTLADINPTTLTADLDDEAVPVLTELVAAQLAGETVDAYKGRLRALVGAGKDT